VVAVSGTLVAQAPGDLRWLRVEDPSAAAACRGAATALAGRLRFPAARTDQLTLAVTEAATNLHKHAVQGSMLLRIARNEGRPGIEMVTIDAGPGLRDTSAALRDGHSTSGTLGIGLGAIRRLADFCDLYSVPGHGTALVARFWPAPPPGPVRCAGLVRPITGETECGDVFGAAETAGVVTGVLCDGLGHGPLAASAATEAVAVVLEDPAAGPAALLERVHRRIAHTRGGAIAIVEVSTAEVTTAEVSTAEVSTAEVTGSAVRFAGLGNVTATILAGGVRRGMLSVPGIAGHQARAIRQFDYTAPPGGAVILHSDGISGRWDAAALPRLNVRDPLVVAATLLAQAGTRRDDAGVLVLKP
jgi:anti-sigma regulatory factor (Ser/Thr protein kinase)